MARVVLNAGEVVLAPRIVDGAAVPTTLALWAAPSQCRRYVRLSVVEAQQAPHRSLSRDLVEILVPRPAVERAARRMVSVLHHLHHGTEGGTTVRLRRSGTFVSVWNVDVLRAGTLLLSWPVPQKSVDDLDRLDLRLQQHTSTPGSSSQMSALREHLGEISADLTRERQVDDVIRQNVHAPIDEVLGILEARDLLAP